MLTRSLNASLVDLFTVISLYGWSKPKPRSYVVSAEESGLDVLSLVDKYCCNIENGCEILGYFKGHIQMDLLTNCWLKYERELFLETVTLDSSEHMQEKGQRLIYLTSWESTFIS